MLVSTCGLDDGKVLRLPYNVAALAETPMFHAALLTFVLLASVLAGQFLAVAVQRLLRRGDSQL